MRFTLFSISSNPLTDTFVHPVVTLKPSLLQHYPKCKSNEAPLRAQVSRALFKLGSRERRDNHRSRSSEDLVGEGTRGIELCSPSVALQEVSERLKHLSSECHRFAFPLSNAWQMRSRCLYVCSISQLRNCATQAALDSRDVPSHSSRVCHRYDQTLGSQ